MRVVYLAIMQGIKPSSIRASRRTADHACTSTDTNIDHILISHPPAHVRSQIIGFRVITAWCQKFFEGCWDVVNTRTPENISAIQESTLISNVETASVRARRPDMGRLPVDHALLHAVRAKHARAVNATHEATQECTAPIETWAQPQQTSKQLYTTKRPSRIWTKRCLNQEFLYMSARTQRLTMCLCFKGGNRKQTPVPLNLSRQSCAPLLTPARRWSIRSPVHSLPNSVASAWSSDK